MAHNSNDSRTGVNRGDGATSATGAPVPTRIAAAAVAGCTPEGVVLSEVLEAKIKRPRPTTRQPVDPITYNIPAACRVSGLGKTTIFALLANQKLVRVKIGKRTLITAESLHALLSSEAA